MSSCEDFQQALKNGNLAEAFLVAMSQAPELHITTWIANPKSAENSDPDKPRSGKCLRTYINLVEGEIINEVGSELMQDRFYTQLQQFHLQQATQGHQTIEQNLQSLQKMFRLMATFQQQQQRSEKLTQSGWLDSPSSSLNSSSPKPFLEAANTIEAEEEEEDSAVFNDIISLADLDVDSDSELPESEIRSPEEEDWGNWLEEDEQKSLKNLKTDFLKFNSTIKPDSETGEEEEWEEWEATEFLASNTPANHDRES
jgi:hypothetical protein